MKPYMLIGNGPRHLLFENGLGLICKHEPSEHIPLQGPALSLSENYTQDFADRSAEYSIALINLAMHIKSPKIHDKVQHVPQTQVLDGHEHDHLPIYLDSGCCGTTYSRLTNDRSLLHNVRRVTSPTSVSTSDSTASSNGADG